MAKTTSIPGKSTAPKKSVKKAPGADPNAPSKGAKKARRRRSNNFLSYVQKIVATHELENGKKSSISGNARKTLNSLVVNVIEEMSLKSKHLAEQRNAKTVGPNQIRFACELIFGRGGKNLVSEALAFCDEKTAKFQLAKPT
jgi:histone H3/H4